MSITQNVSWLASLSIIFLGACSTLESDAKAGPGRLSDFYVATGIDVRKIPFGYFYGAGFTSHDSRQKARKNDLFECPSPPASFTILVTNANQCNELTSVLMDAPISSTEALRGIKNVLIGIDDHRIAYETWNVSRNLRRIEVPAYTGWGTGWAQSATSTYAHEAMHFVFETAYWQDKPVVTRHHQGRFIFISEGLAELAEKACSPSIKIEHKEIKELDIRGSLNSLSDKIGKSNDFEIVFDLRNIINDYFYNYEILSDKACEEIFLIVQSRPHEIDANFIAEFAMEMRGNASNTGRRGSKSLPSPARNAK
jgi:hypothetical protein